MSETSKTAAINFKEILAAMEPKKREAAQAVIQKHGISQQTQSNWKRKVPAAVMFFDDLAAVTGMKLQDFLTK